MKIALAQTNPTVGDIEGNANAILEKLNEASARGAELILFPELAVFGYPPKDLLLREELIAENVAALQRCAAACKNIAAVIGFVQPVPDGTGKGIYNAAAYCGNTSVKATYAKRLLPTYDVFDELRYFSAGTQCSVVTLERPGGPLRLGLTICEDIWNDVQFGGRPVYGVDPISDSVRAGAEMIVNIGASPFVAGKQFRRETIFGPQVEKHHVPLVSVNQVGGNDDLIFDGSGFALDAQGRVTARAPAFDTSLWVFDTEAPSPNDIAPYPDRLESMRQALVLGVRDYLRKCGFAKAFIGLSGGIDSAVTTAIAVDALGPEAVCGIAMPSRYSSDHSLEDARQLADNLRIEFQVIEIDPVHRAMESTLAPHFGNLPPGLAEENIQARLRGNILMALCNKHDRILLTTGNKSEWAVGYCTLYGDMCGGLAVLCDVPKTTVYELAESINRRAGTERIPLRTISKPPSAELRHDQQDQDSLPPYEVLDAILARYVEEDDPADAIIAAGFDPQIVRSVIAMVDRSEYKRQQAAVGLKVTSRAFGSGRRMPIAAKY